ncbi:hypothetical protein O9G_000172 [Rozella allomycis CSF55]|uniref:Uncharacterized protein n=1 Tax=Rozella allomycis (strain CSF55) TaxID=988480 RepID=A0A075AT58_ROZAC|nr:hypothetical protein O9G_000172 [Rozella allomycis CSF55]|eukprot:EPZ31693.1 hypothetical protein O9G_000172 [Rozella allomycis CSF55]
MPGVLENMATEVSESRARKFEMMHFVDTPGLVDGDMNYPFDPDQVLNFLAEEAHLILVFFDPIGQALCRRTMNIVEKLHDVHGDKMRYYLSKADTVPDESDRQRVLIQITQNLTARLKNKQFELPPIFIPTLTDKESSVKNHIDGVCNDIEKVINLNVQNTLNSFENDTVNLLAKITE